MSTRSSDQPAPDTTRLAVYRRWLAHEQALIAWVHTATTMIGFGLIIYGLFQLEVRHVGRKHGVITPRDLALMMISMGLIALLPAAISRRKKTKGISKRLRRSRGSLAEIVAGLIFALGILALLAVFLHY